MRGLFVQSTEYADIKSAKNGQRTENKKKNHKTEHSRVRRTTKRNAVTKLIRKQCGKIQDKEDFLSISALKIVNKNTDNKI
jgi:hypothetical protein